MCGFLTGNGVYLNVKCQGKIRKHQTIFSFRVISKFTQIRAFPSGSVVKNPPANAGDKGVIPDPGRSHTPRSN